MLSSLDKSPDAANLELVERHRALYEGRRSTPHSRTSFATPPVPRCLPGIFSNSCAVRAPCTSTVMSRWSQATIRVSTFARGRGPISRSDHASRVRHGGVDRGDLRVLLRQELSPRHRMLGYWPNAPANSSPGDCRCGWS